MKKKKKLEAYSKDGRRKYNETDFDDGRKKKKNIRQEARDANRRLKKSKRQELKENLRKIISNI